MAFDYVGDLKAVRAAFVAERRRIARTAIETAAANKDEHASISIARDIKYLQEQIDAVDKAIEDEDRGH